MYGVSDGARTHDHRNHNPELYQLSYAHHTIFALGQLLAWCHHFSQIIFRKISYLLSVNLRSLLSENTLAQQPDTNLTGAPDRTRTCNLRLSVPLQLSLVTADARYSGAVFGLSWSGLYLHHFRWDTYSLYGSQSDTTDSKVHVQINAHDLRPFASARPTSRWSNRAGGLRAPR